MKSGSFVKVISMTEPKLLKRGNPLANATITKVTNATLQFGYSYENSVNNRTDEEFVAEALPWGKWVEGQVNRILEHNGEYYGRFYELKNGHRDVLYLVDGEFATDEQIEIIKQFTPKSKSNRQEEVGISIENQVKPRSYKFSSIVGLKCGELEYSAYEVALAR
jgi:hypothetical protein